MKFVAIAGLLLAGVGLADNPKDDFKREGSEAHRADVDPLEGKAPPTLLATNWLNTNGKPVKFEDLKGKVIVIDFWGTWCGPCRAAIPHLKELYSEHKKDGLVIIGIHTTRGSEEMAALVKEKDIPWPIAADDGGKTIRAYKVDSYPDYYLIDRSGKMRVADLANADLERVVKILLKEPATK